MRSQNVVDWWGSIFLELDVPNVTNVIAICWAIWGARNSLVVEGVRKDPTDVVRYALKTIEEVYEAGSAGRSAGQTVAGGVSAPVRWQALAMGVAKVNVDAGFVGELGCGLGAVIRSGEGTVLAAGVQQGEESWEVRVAEAQAILWGLRLAASSGLQEVIVESDCLQVIQALRSKEAGSSKNIEIQQQEKVPSPSVTQKGQSEDKEQQDKASDDKEQQEKASEDKKQQEKASDGKEQQEILADVEDQEKLSLGAEIIEEVSAKMESLKDLSEPPVKKQKTDETTVSLSNEEDMIQHDAVTNENSEDAVINENSEDAVTNENSEDAVKPLEEANNTVLPKETNISPPQIAISLKDSSVVDFPTVMEQDICTNSGFQISMENPDDEDELSEPPNDISPMETEQGGDK